MNNFKELTLVEVSEINGGSYWKTFGKNLLNAAISKGEYELAKRIAIAIVSDPELLLPLAACL